MHSKSLTDAVTFIIAIALVCCLHNISCRPIEDDETDSLRESLLLMANRQDVAGIFNNRSSDSLSMVSPFSICVQACTENLSSVNALHTCHRECMMDPNKYTLTNKTDQASVAQLSIITTLEDSDEIIG